MNSGLHIAAEFTVETNFTKMYALQTAHAVGILVEGMGCVLAGMWGNVAGVTSYSENIGIIGVTKVSV